MSHSPRPPAPPPPGAAASAPAAADATAAARADRPGTLRSLAAAMTSWRTASVSLLSFAQGMPLGLVWIAIPDWMRNVGVDIRVVGLFTLAQAPWSFKILWSPFIDRYALPWLGRRRGWAAVAQLALFMITMALSGVGEKPESPWIVLALALGIALACSIQDIAVDAYAVDVLRPEEQGVAVGARVALYRAAMYAAGGLTITLAKEYSWPLVNAILALTYLPILLVTWKAPEPPDVPRSPRTLREAVWHPFLGMLGRHRALEILAFVFFYKIADNLALALLRPFLIDKGYSDFDRGVVLATISAVCTIGGAMVGGVLTTAVGVGRSLWIFGLLQITSNLGYVLVARADLDRPLMFAANAFETLTSGMGTGAFSVLLLRLTQKRFSATQYALFSSLFSLPRIVAGPISGFVVDAIGWESFFWATIVAGVPGMLLLQRFSPAGVREPSFEVQPPRDLRPLTRGALAARGAVGGLCGLLFGALCVAGMAALKGMRAHPEKGFDIFPALAALLLPSGIGGWLELAGVVSFGALAGLAAAAVTAARHGAAQELAGGGGAAR